LKELLRLRGEAIMETRVYETNDYMDMNDVAAKLVKLYADYMHNNTEGFHDDDYARAVGIAIRMLSD
jgi:hypothetical protein